MKAHFKMLEIAIILCSFFDSLAFAKCFPETGEEICISCAFDYYSQDYVPSRKFPYVRGETCIKKIGDLVSRKVLLTQEANIIGCYKGGNTSAKEGCMEFLDFFSGFNSIYDNFQLALLAENLKLIPYKISSLQIYVLGRIELDGDGGDFQDFYYFFKGLATNITIKKLPSCIKEIYSESKPWCTYIYDKASIVINKLQAPIIYVNFLFYSENVNFEFIILKAGLIVQIKAGSIFNLNIIEDLLPQLKPTFIMENCEFLDLSGSTAMLLSVFYVRIQEFIFKLADLEIKNFGFAQSFLIVEISNLNNRAKIEPFTSSTIWLESIKFGNISILPGTSRLVHLAVALTEIKIKKVFLSDIVGNVEFVFLGINSVKINQTVIIEEISIINSQSTGLASILNCQATFLLRSIFIKNISGGSNHPWATFENVLAIKLEGLFLEGISNLTGGLITAISSLDLQIVDCNFSQLSNLTIEAKNSMFIANRLNICNSYFQEYSFSLFQTNFSLSESRIFSHKGPGVMFKQFRGKLMINAVDISKVQGLVVISFSELTEHVISNSSFSNIYTQYFWVRNTQLEKQIILNCSFSNGSFLRFQSLYKVFLITPIVIYKDCQFENLSFSVYGFDYCCINFVSVNNRYQNIEIAKGSLSLYALEQNGNYFFQHARFIDVGWRLYERSSSGALNQRTISLFYPSSFSVADSQFLMTKDLSLRSGFITSVDFNSEISIKSCTFIVMYPSRLRVIRGLLFLGIRTVTITDCIFVNLTADLISSDFTHFNGVISMLGTVSFMEKKASLNRLFLTNVTVENVFAKNGAGLTLVSYNESILINCRFINGTAFNGFGGLIAVVFVHTLININSTFVDGTATSTGGLIHIQDVMLVYFYVSVFQLSKSGESAGGLSMNNIQFAYLYRVTAVNLMTTGHAGFLYFLGGSLIIYESTLKNITSVNSGTIFFLEGLDTLNLYKCEIFDSVGVEGTGGVIFGDGNTLVLTGVVIINLQTFSDGSLLFMESFVSISVFGCYFEYIECIGFCRTGLIFANSLLENSIIVLRKTNFTNLLSREGNFLFTQSDLTLFFSQIRIEAFWGYKIMDLSGINSMVSIFRELFLEANVLTGTSAVHLSLSITYGVSIYMINNRFYGSLINGYEIVLDFDTISLVNCTRGSNFTIWTLFYFESSFLKFSGLYLNFQYKRLNLSHQVFHLHDATFFLTNNNLKEQLNNTALIFAEDSNLRLCKNQLNFNGQAELELIALKGVKKKAVISVTECKFVFGIGFLLSLTRIDNIEIETTDFISAITFGLYKLSRAIVIHQATNININNSSFLNMKAAEGASIYIQVTALIYSKIKVFSTIFKNSTSQLGGALFIVGFFNLTIEKCLFIENSASSEDLPVDKYTGIGAGGFLVCYSDRCGACIVDSEFEKNRADGYAPTLFANFRLDSISNNQFRGNLQGPMRLVYEGFFAYPFKLQIFQNEIGVEVIKFKSGRGENINILLTDSAGYPLDSIHLYDAKFKLPLNNINEEKISIQNEIAYKKEGLLQFLNTVIKANSGLNTTLILSVDYLTSPGLKPKANFEYEIPVLILECQEGEIIQLDLSCKKCSKGTYAMGSPQNEIECKKCPNEFDCLGGTEIYPKPGFWRQNSFELMAMNCIVQQACIGSQKVNMTQTDREHGACRNGHYGNLCHSCIPGYGKRKSRGLCEECKGQTSILYFRLAILMFILLIIIIFISFSKVQTGEDAIYLELIIFKIFLNHIQQFSIISFMEDLGRVPLFEEVLNFQSYLSLISDDFVSLDCILKRDTNSNNDFQILIFLVMPFFVGSILLLLWQLLALVYLIKINEKRESPKNLLIRRIIITFAISAYLLYPLILQSAFNLPNCLEVPMGSNKPKVYLLYANPNIECWGDSHLSLILYLFIPAIILWGVLFPLFFFLVLKKSKSISLKNTKGSRSTFSLAPEIKINSTKLRQFLINLDSKIFMFFYDDYRKKLYYWEVIVFLKKFFLTALSGVRNSFGQEMKLFSISFVLMAYLLLLIKMRPFCIEICNRLEFFSDLLSLAFIIFLTFLNFHQDLEEINYIALAIFIANIVYLLTLAVYALKNILQKVSNRLRLFVYGLLKQKQKAPQTIVKINFTKR